MSRWTFQPVDKKMNVRSDSNYKTNWFIRLRVIALLLAALLFTNLSLPAQNENAYVCTKGKIHFFSAAFTGDIEATSDLAICVINTKTNKVFAKVRQATFSFKQKLMQEHFNENYMETDKFPYAILDMAIAEKPDYSKDGTFDITLKGTLEMHGAKVAREISGKLVIKNGQPVSATAMFYVKLADHKIKIPNIVGATVADQVKVDVEFSFEKYKGD